MPDRTLDLEPVHQATREAHDALLSEGLAQYYSLVR